MREEPTSSTAQEKDRIALASSFYEEFLRILSLRIPVREKYAILYSRFVDLLLKGTVGSGRVFSGPYPRMLYLAQKAGYDALATNRLNAFRVRGRETQRYGDEELERHFLGDLRQVAELTQALFHHPLPPLLAARLPLVFKEERIVSRSVDCWRVSVLEVREDSLLVRSQGPGSCDKSVSLFGKEPFRDHSYLRPLLRPGVQLNIVRPKERNGLYECDFIILEPDYLVDISSVAASFEDYGVTPLTFLLQKIRPKAWSEAILLGQFASQLLDEAVLGEGKRMPPYEESAARFFSRYALQLASCSDLSGNFHEEAKRQREHILKAVALLLEEDENENKRHLLIEPSFLCEALGLQGRMDLLREDYSLLLEQKSGRGAFGSAAHQEKHYVQMLLYRAVLYYGFSHPETGWACYLFYSKYPEGLVREGSAPELLFRALKLRNEIVAQEYALAEGSSSGLFSLSSEQLNLRGRSIPLWSRYKAPAIDKLLAPLHEASALERAYFTRFFSFSEREHLLSRVGDSRREASGQAALWSLSFQEKMEAGEILSPLSVSSLLYDADKTVITGITLSLQSAWHEGNGMPNFREGDIVALYAYSIKKEPDVRKSMVHRCSVVSLRTGEITLSFRTEQHWASLFTLHGGYAWAVEHDHMDSSYRIAYRGLYAFLSAEKQRRDLLLGVRAPQSDERLCLNLDHSLGGKSPYLNTLALRAKRAKDYFLLVGPPGTGKTSFGLMSILRETLSDPTPSVLLSAFTNRAVDEICSKLVNEGLDFLRVGSASSVNARYRPFLMEDKLRSLSSVAAVRTYLSSVRIVVGTLHSLSSCDSLFSLKHFHLALIDEAGQILEPQLLPLLSARHAEGMAIDKFVLIGDHKQLPAVVMQSESEALVRDRTLQGIGLTSCARSLFERLLSLQKDSHFVFSLTFQGRMHPDTAAFASKAFYGGALLPLSLPHQQRDRLFCYSGSNPLCRLLSSHRFLFISSPLPSPSSPDKVNLPEAWRIAQVALSLVRLHTDAGRPFSPESSLGVIVPYRAQIAVVRETFRCTGEPLLEQVNVDTVERYQGSERDVIIYGFTAHRPIQMNVLSSSSFVDDGRVIDRKLNVALTRAREQTIVIGNVALLERNPLFHTLITHCKGLGALCSLALDKTCPTFSSDRK